MQRSASICQLHFFMLQRAREQKAKSAARTRSAFTFLHDYSILGRCVFVLRGHSPHIAPHDTAPIGAALFTNRRIHNAMESDQ
jgi:hypothetical protein